MHFYASLNQPDDGQKIMGNGNTRDEDEKPLNYALDPTKPMYFSSVLYLLPIISQRARFQYLLFKRICFDTSGHQGKRLLG